MINKYFWSFDNDKDVANWGICEDSIAECLKQARHENILEETEHKFVYIGEGEVSYAPNVCVTSLLEELLEQTRDNVGELAELFVINFKDKEAIEELNVSVNNVVTEWLKKHAYYQEFYTIVNVGKYKLVGEE